MKDKNKDNLEKYLTAQRINNINLVNQFMGMYLKDATKEEFEYFRELIKTQNYNEIKKIINEYANKLVFNENEKKFSFSEESKSMKCM